MNAKNNKPTVIVADDNPSSAVYLSVVLGRMNLSVLPLPDGRDVVRMAKKMDPDLIFLDAEMSGRSGIDAMIDLLDDRATSNIPIAVVALKEDTETHARLAEIGSDMILHRPIDPHQLHDIVSRNINTPYKVKRRYLRVATDKKVFMLRQDKLRSYNAVSLSERGVFIRETEPMKEGSKATVVIPLDGGNRLLLNGEIIYTRDLYGKMFDTGPGMAIEFKDIVGRDSIRLRNYIGGLIERGVA